MIITGVHAKNVLKYRELKLDDLPAQGVIAISGANESGKSSIGETVCFALFGRTFSLGPEQLDRIVRWGENHCSVVLRFRVRDREYELSRFLDRNGNHSAKLCPADDADSILARGVEAVGHAVYDLLGYEFDEFIESFYLAQREITTPHPHSHAVRIMAGVEPLEQAVQTFERDIAKQQEMLADLNTELETLEAENLALEYEPGHLGELEEAVSTLQGEVESITASKEYLQETAQTYISNVAQIAENKGSLARTRFFRFFSFLLAAVTGAVWGLLKLDPNGDEAQMLLREVLQYYPDLNATHLLGLGFVAIVFAVFWLLLWMRVSSIRNEVQRLEAESASLAAAMEEVHAIEAPEMEEILSQDEENPEQEYEEQEYEEVDPDTEVDSELVSSYSLPLRPDDSDYADLYAAVGTAAASASAVADYLGVQSDWLDSLVAYKQQQIEDLQQDIRNEQDRVRHYERLQEVANGLNQRVEEIQQRIESQRISIALLQGASEYMSNNFNRDVKDLVAKTLPIFTQSRYEHLRIDSDLNVKVFSSDKREFMDLEEVSSGTQRQIMLALRLALSQKLLNRAVKGNQFAFLDEPFAFFDEQRTLNALSALNDLSDGLSQIWIVSQTFPSTEELRFAVTLHCTREQDQLLTA